MNSHDTPPHVSFPVIILYLLIMTDLQLPDFGSDNKSDQSLLQLQFLKCEFDKAEIITEPVLYL